MAFSTQPKMWYWVVAIVFLLWNLMGLGMFAAEMSDPSLITADFTPEQLSIYNNRAWWYMPNFGLAVIAGTLSCVLLLFKRKLAVTLALISLIAVVISTIYEVFISGSWETLKGVEKGFLFLIPFIDVLLLLFTKMAAKRTWIR